MPWPLSGSVVSYHNHIQPPTPTVDQIIVPYIIAQSVFKENSQYVFLSVIDW